MYCQYCGTEIESNNSDCHSCGNKSQPITKADLEMYTRNIRLVLIKSIAIVMIWYSMLFTGMAISSIMYYYSYHDDGPNWYLQDTSDKVWNVCCYGGLNYLPSFAQRIIFPIDKPYGELTINQKKLYEFRYIIWYLTLSTLLVLLPIITHRKYVNHNK